MVSKFMGINMKIKMTNFKCFSSYNIILHVGEVILLKGNSGVGKTTVFDAITWCLYGENKNVGDNTSVTITTSIITITRNRLPKYLEVIYNSIKYLDKNAQEIINTVFGTFRFWRITSYLPQGERNNFFSLTKQEKFDLLYDIAFNNENPRIYLEKIKNIISKYEIEIETLKRITSEINLPSAPIKYTSSIELRKHLEHITVELKDKETQLIHTKNYYLYRRKWDELFNFPPQSSIELERQFKLCDELDNLEKYKDLPITNYTLDDYNDEIKKHFIYKTNYKLATELGIEYKYSVIQKEIIDLIETIKQQEHLSMYLKKLKLQKKIITLQEKLNNLGNISLSENYTEQDYLNIYRLYENYIHNFNICADLSVEYKETVIQQEINHIKNILDKYTKKYIFLEYQDVANLSLTQEEEKLNNFYLGCEKNILNCPKCSTVLIFCDGKLIFTQEDKINEQLKKIARIKEYIEKGIISTDLELCSNLSDEEILFLKKKLSLLEKVNIIDKPLDPEYIKKCIEANKLSKKITKKTNKLNQLYKDITNPTNIQKLDLSILRQRLMKLQQIDIIQEPSSTPEYINRCLSKQKIEINIRELGGIDSLTSRNKNIIKQQLELVKKLEIYYTENPPINEKEIEELNTKKKQIREELESSIKHEETLSLRKKKQNLLNQLENNNTYLNKLYKLNEIMNKVAIDTLTNINHNMNIHINKVLSSIFTEPITVTVKLNKKLKNKVNRNEINFDIFYRNNRYNELKQLSGGEGDRISLAFTITMNILCGSKILLIDETLHSLETDTVKKCIDVLKEMLPNRIIVIVGHETVNGYYDLIHDI
jgi:DNA repair exonuclease SbcCD ATPase subunit